MRASLSAASTIDVTWLAGFFVCSCWFCGANWTGYGHRCAYFGDAAPKSVSAWNAKRHTDGEKKALAFSGAGVASGMEDEEVGIAPSHRTKRGARQLMDVQRELGTLTTAQDIIEERLKVGWVGATFRFAGLCRFRFESDQCPRRNADDMCRL